MSDRIPLTHMPRRFDVETKIRLTSGQRAGLDVVALRRHTTRAQEIRRSIDRYLAALNAPELKNALDVLAVLDDTPAAEHDGSWEGIR